MKRFLLLLMFMSFSATCLFAQTKDSRITSVTNNITIKKVTVSPNPASADVKLTIEGNQANLRSVAIYSIIGNEVFSKQYNTNSKTIDLDVRSLKQGKYMVRVMFDDNTTEVTTLIKQ